MIHHDIPLITKCCQEVAMLQGDAAEIGVYRGLGAKLICELLPDAMVYLFDTFKGFPEDMITAGADGAWQPGQWGDTSLARVQQELSGTANYKLVQGVFPDSAASLQPSLRFVHIDCDLYRSTLKALEWSWRWLVPGGVILDDDYLCPSCPGAKRAVEEFCKQRSVSCERVGSRAILRRPT